MQINQIFLTPAREILYQSVQTNKSAWQTASRQCREAIDRIGHLDAIKQLVSSLITKAEDRTLVVEWLQAKVDKAPSSINKCLGKLEEGKMKSAAEKRTALQTKLERVNPCPIQDDPTYQGYEGSKMPIYLDLAPGQTFSFVDYFFGGKLDTAHLDQLKMEASQALVTSDRVKQKRDRLLHLLEALKTEPMSLNLLKRCQIDAETLTGLPDNKRGSFRTFGFDEKLPAFSKFMYALRYFQKRATDPEVCRERLRQRLLILDQAAAPKVDPVKENRIVALFKSMLVLLQAIFARLKNRLEELMA